MKEKKKERKKERKEERKQQLLNKAKSKTTENKTLSLVAKLVHVFLLKIYFKEEVTRCPHMGSI